MTPRYILRRLAQALPTVAGIIVVTFALVHLAPGDPIVALAGESGDEAHYRFMREKFGLDRPLAAQFTAYATNVLTADLGTSFVHGRPVFSVIVERLPATLLLMVTALVVSSAVGIALGAVVARRPGGALDLGVTVAALVGYAVPAFWLGQVALLTLAFGTGWFPLQGMTDARASNTGVEAVVDVAHHLALPALVLAASELAMITRLTRAGLLQELGKDYVRFARAKGVAPGRAMVRHALPNALLPVITVIGARVGFLFSGAVLIETVFAWPGLGQLLLSAVRTRDYPVLMGVFLLVSLAVVVANLVTDLIYARIDPRIRYR
ncbi:MAG: ABC transporter permease [Acidimicrobiia bacterium]